MKRKPVTSSNVASVGYDDRTQTLEIEFNNGWIYQYQKVPSKIYDQLMTSSSKGSFLHHHIKGKFRYTRIK